MLEYLAGHAGRLVTKNEFMDRLWPGVFVGDAALKVCVREIRRALGDDPQHPRFIETAHRRGYRFIAPVTLVTSPTADAPLVAAASDTSASGAELPTTRYARTGDVNIAYQVVGDAPIDLVFVMGWVSHLDYFWREPSFARFLKRLASFSRLDPVRQTRHRPVRPCGRGSSSAWTTCVPCWKPSAHGARRSSAKRAGDVAGFGRGAAPR